VKSLVGLWIVLSVWLTAGEINIAVAANVSYAIKPLIEAFEKSHQGMKVVPIIGSSGKLTAQIRHHAPFSLFLSANVAYPQHLYDEGIAKEAPVVYAKGRLALFCRKGCSFKEGIKTLLQPWVERVALANPQTAPYGVATQEALRHAGVDKALRKRVIYGESIGQTLTYATRITSMGVVAKSALYAPSMQRFKEGKMWQEVEPNLYAPIAQGMVLIPQKQGQATAQAFYDFMRSKQAQTILRHYGYDI